LQQPQAGSAFRAQQPLGRASFVAVQAEASEAHSVAAIARAIVARVVLARRLVMARPGG